MASGPITLLAPISLFLQLLSPYHASVVLLGMFIVCPLSCLLRLFYCLKFPVFYLMEYSGKHDISLLTSQANVQGTDMKS